MLNGLINSLLENDIRTHENNRKFATGPEDDYEWLPTKSSLFQRKLYVDCDRFK